MAGPAVNNQIKENRDTGFGVQSNQLGERFVNKDGSFNILKTGYPWYRRLSVYSWFLRLSWPQFLLEMVLLYLLINVLFTGVYLLVGTDQLTGFVHPLGWRRLAELYFFSTQTFTTVGYGRINPIGIGADVVSSLESMTGWMFFALVTGLLYGRFTQPKAYLAFSHNAVIGPYRGGRGLMFRLVPYKGNHHLTDAKLAVNIALNVMENGMPEFKFYRLNLERSRVDTLSMNWTVVHPLDEQSPIQHFTPEDMRNTDVELYVQVSGFDPIFSNTVIQRTSYTYKEIIWDAKFKPMYHESADGSKTILELDKLNDFERVTQ